MIILIAGASHSGKTNMAQQLLEKFHYPYLSIDHLKMGLIRSGQTDLTPEDDDELVDYLWPIVREMIKTAIENKQNLIVEGIYIPFTWRDDFEEEYLGEIEYRCIILAEGYIRRHFDEIKNHANIIEDRLDNGWLTEERLIADNNHNLTMCVEYGLPYILIEEDYESEIQS